MFPGMLRRPSPHHSQGSYPRQSGRRHCRLFPVPVALLAQVDSYLGWFFPFLAGSGTHNRESGSPYLADTMHLSAEEHGAYLLLMFNYWQTGKPIPKNRLAKIARLTNERWADVEPSLQEFFCDNGEEWVHLRIEEDLASVREKLTKKSAAGKASVQARRSRKEADVQTKQERNLTGVQTDVEVVFEHDVNTKATNKDTDKDLKTDPPLNPPRGNRGVKKFDPLDIALPNWISVSLWREWVEFRQALRKPIRTEQGANGAIRELEKFRQQGFSPEQVIRHSIANEYQGLFAPKGVRPETLLRQVNTVSLPDSAIPPGFRG